MLLTPPETFANVTFFATGVKEPAPNDIISVESRYRRR